jgi:hypothetical protein
VLKKQRRKELVIGLLSGLKFLLDRVSGYNADKAAQLT